MDLYWININVNWRLIHKHPKIGSQPATLHMSTWWQCYPAEILRSLGLLPSRKIYWLTPNHYERMERIFDSSKLVKQSKTFHTLIYSLATEMSAWACDLCVFSPRLWCRTGVWVVHLQALTVPSILPTPAAPTLMHYWSTLSGPRKHRGDKEKRARLCDPSDSA